MENKGNYSVYAVHPKENARVGLGRHRSAFDRGARHQPERRRSCIWAINTARAWQACKCEMKIPTVDGGGKQKSKQWFLVTGILFTFGVNTSTPDVSSE